ncbi:MAG: outer membrane protein assembly factor BamD [Bacteroidota bacterium]
MIKKLTIIALSALFLQSCASSVNTQNMSPEEHLNYAMSIFNDEDYIGATAAFQTLLLQYPGSAVSDDAQYYLAESHFRKKEYILAAYEYSRLIKDMPASEFVPKAQYMLAESYFQLSPNFQLDQKYTRKSIEEFQAFIDFFPADEKVKDAESKIQQLNDKLAQKEFNTAHIYERMELNEAAIFYYDVVTNTYHDSKYAPEATYKKVSLYRDKKDMKNTLHEIDSYLQKYPNGPAAGELKKLQEKLLKGS